MHYWVRASSGDFSGSLPPPRSGHTAVGIGSSKVVFFGGFIDKKFLNDIFVLDVENNSWFQPECTGNGSDGQVGPSPRAFHVAVSIDCHMFIFGGRSGGKRLGDFWVLDTDIWQWSELTSFGDLPSARDFAAASAIGNQKIVMYGGWDGKKWLSDVYILDTISLEWTELSASGSLPPPRCGHTATMIEKRLLVYGGRGGGGPIMGDLWALKGLIEGGKSISLAIGLIINRSIDVSIDDIWIIDHFHFFHNVDISCNGSASETKSDQSRVLSATVDLNEENETPGWTQLKLPGQAPSPRCGHTVTSGGVYLLMFGGHGTGGWLSRYDIYYNDCIILDRVSAQWKRLPTANDAPPARAYHSMTCIGSRHLLFGGFDGKVTFGDLWWLVPEGDPIAKRPPSSPPRDPATTAMAENIEGPRREESAISELRKRLNITVPLSSSERHIVDESEDKEFCDLALMFSGENVANDTKEAIMALRDHWKTVEPKSILLKELGPLLRDYQRLITRQMEEILSLVDSSSKLVVIDDAGSNPQSIESGLLKKESSRYYHLRNATQLKMDDVSKLLEEYRQLLSHEKQTGESTVTADVHEKH